MTDMFKDPKAYGDQLITYNIGNLEDALKSSYEAAQMYRLVPLSFWADVAKYLVMRINKSK